MSDATETTKNATRGAAMARTWAARREWAANPVCCCGCGAKIGFVQKDREILNAFANPGQQANRRRKLQP
jgi:hypothetical protein